MLTARDRQTYETRLHQERRRAVRILEESISEQVVDDIDGDRGDRAALENERHLDALVSTLEADTVVAIDNALRILVTSPELYGVCRHCGRRIATGRLDVLPWAVECERHASKR